MSPIYSFLLDNLSFFGRFKLGFALEIEDRVQYVNMNNPECWNNLSVPLCVRLCRHLSLFHGTWQSVLKIIAVSLIYEHSKHWRRHFGTILALAMVFNQIWMYLIWMYRLHIAMFCSGLILYQLDIIDIILQYWYNSFNIDTIPSILIQPLIFNIFMVH